MKTALSYCRISDDRTGDGAGVKRQRADNAAFCEKRGLAVLETFVENDVGAYKRRRPRPEYQRMLELIEAGKADAIVVWHLDRLYRNTKELEALIDLVETTKVKVFTVSGGDYDLNTSDGRAMARVVVAFAQKESEDKSRRTIRKHRELAELGQVVGGGRPFGYEADRVTVRPAEAELVREAAERVIAGESLWSIARSWDLRALRTARDARWSQTHLRRVLTSYRIAGVRSYKGTPLTKAAWPAIVDAETHRRVRAILLDPGRRQNGGPGFGARKYLLTGFLFCGKCQTRLIARANQQRRRTYVCSSGPTVRGCGGIRIVAEETEHEVFERMLVRLADGLLADAAKELVDEGEEGELLDEVVATEAKLNEVAVDHYERSLISRDQFLAATKALEDRLDGLRRRLGGRQRAVAALQWTTAEELAAAWPHIALEQKRLVLSQRLTRIEIRPAVPGHNRFDPARVAVDWLP